MAGNFKREGGGQDFKKQEEKGGGKYGEKVKMK